MRVPRTALAWLTVALHSSAATLTDPGPLAQVAPVADAQSTSATVRGRARPMSRDAFEAFLERRAPTTLTEWARAHPDEVGDQARGLLVRVADSRRGTDRARQERLEALARVFADALGRGTVAAWLRTVANWTAEDALQWETARGALASIAESIDAGHVDEDSLSIESLQQLVPEGGMPLCQSALVKIANALFHADRRDLGRPLVTAIVDTAVVHQQGEYILWGESWLGQDSWIGGDLAQARAHYERALSIARAFDDDAGSADLQCNLTSIELSLGDVEAALQRIVDAEQSARSAGNVQLVRRALQLRASGLTEVGELQAALDLLSSDELGDRKPAADEMQVRLDILHSNTLSDVGRLEAARTYIDRALELVAQPAVRRTAPMLRAEVLLSRGLLQGDAHETDAAIATLNDALDMFRSAGDARGVAWAQKNLGFVLQGGGRHAEALRAFAQAQEYGEREDLPFLAGWSAMGRVESARAIDPLPTELDTWLSQAERCADRLQSWHLAWRVEAARGEFAARRGDDAAALAHWTRAVDAIEKLRRRLDSPALLTHYLRDKSNPYRDAAFAAARTGSVAEAWRFAELLRARVLSELRSKGHGATTDLHDDASVASARRALASVESLVRADSGERRAALTARVHAAEADLDRALLEAELRAPRSLRLSGVGVQSFDADAVRARLAPNGLDALVEIVVGEKAALALVLTSKASSATLLPIGAAEIESLVRRLRDPIEAVRCGDLDLASLGFDVPAARELYDALLRPLESELGPRIAIVPDGVLASLPFESLVVTGGSDPVDPAHPFAHLRTLQFLGLERAIVYLPAARMLPVMPTAPRAEGSGTLVCLAPPSRGLASAPIEAAALTKDPAQLFQPVRVLQAESADDVKRASPAVRFLHFAAHGVLVSDNPASSHLLFGVDGTERLEAWEIESLPLRAQLAVLSACHTGEGRTWSGEGLLGLTRSFLAAGVHDVVGSAWAVEDRATGEWMATFYSELGHGADTVDAARAARRNAFATDDPRGFSRAHPYFWAAWVVYRGE